MMPTGMALYRLPLDKERLLSLELRPPWQFYRNGSGSSNRWKKSNVKLSGVGCSCNKFFGQQQVPFSVHMRPMAVCDEEINVSI